MSIQCADRVAQWPSGPLGVEAGSIPVTISTAPARTGSHRGLEAGGSHAPEQSVVPAGEGRVCSPNPKHGPHRTPPFGEAHRTGHPWTRRSHRRRPATGSRTLADVQAPTNGQLVLVGSGTPVRVRQRQDACPRRPSGHATCRDFGSIAQRPERPLVERDVAGSIPAGIARSGFRGGPEDPLSRDCLREPGPYGGSHGSGGQGMNRRLARNPVNARKSGGERSASSVG